MKMLASCYYHFADEETEARWFRDSSRSEQLDRRGRPKLWSQSWHQNPRILFLKCVPGNEGLTLDSFAPRSQCLLSIALFTWDINFLLVTSSSNPSTTTDLAAQHPQLWPHGKSPGQQRQRPQGPPCQPGTAATCPWARHCCPCIELKMYRQKNLHCKSWPPQPGQGPSSTQSRQAPWSHKWGRMGRAWGYGLLDSNPSSATSWLCVYTSPQTSVSISKQTHNTLTIPHRLFLSITWTTHITPAKKQQTTT